MRNLLTVLGLVGVLAGSGTVAHAAFSDDFNTAQASTSYNGSSGLSTGTTLLTGYGSRTLYSQITANTAPGDARARTAITNGAFTFSSDNEVTGEGLADYSFSTPINLLLAPAFQITILSNDLTGFVIINEYDTSGHAVAISATLPATPVSGVPLVIVVPANLTSSINASSINRLIFYFGGTKGEDLSIDSIVQVVPEPGSLALLGAAAAGVGLAVRRGRRA